MSDVAPSDRLTVSDRITIVVSAAMICVTIITTSIATGCSTNARIDDLKESVNASLDNMTALVGGRFDDVNARFDDVNARIDDVNARFDDVNARIDNLETSVNRELAYLRQRIDSHIHGHDATVEVLAPGEAPGGLAYADGQLFLADGGALREIDPETGANVRTARATDVGQVASVHRDGGHLVLSGSDPSGSTLVTVWDPRNGTVVKRIPFDGTIVDALAYGSGFIVSAYGASPVLRLHPETPNERTPIGGELLEPAGLALRDGNLFVADRAGSVFWIIKDGETLDPAVKVASGLGGPEGLAVDDDGALYVVEVEAGRVSRIDVQSGETTVVADRLALRHREPGTTASVRALAGIAVGDGALFVSAWDRVYRIRR